MRFLRQRFGKKKRAGKPRGVIRSCVMDSYETGCDLLAFAFTARILFEFHLVVGESRLGIRIGLVLIRHFFFTRGASTSQGHS